MEATKKRDSPAMIAVAVVVVGLFFGMVTWLRTEQPKTESPPEILLGQLDTGNSLDKDDVKVVRIRYLLGHISKATGERPQYIADRTSRATLVLKQDYGKIITNQDFLEEANRFYTSQARTITYDDLCASLVILMGK